MNIKKVFLKYKEVIMYLIFGFFTTLVNIISYYLCTRIVGFNEYFSNILAWFLSVLFAFITNKYFVFESKNVSIKIIVKECISFFSFRILSLVFDIAIMFLMISILNINDMISKVVANIVVIILNYIFSKLFIFNKKECYK